MKKNNILLKINLLCIFFILACSKSEDDQIAYRITEQDLIPEGITYSSSQNSFYLSSLFKKKIIQIDAETGKFEDFIKSNLLNLKVLGVIVDEKRKHLWACAFGVRDKIHTSTVAKINLMNGELINSYTLTDTVENIFNDLFLDKTGNVYFTNTSNHTVYKIGSTSDSISIFFTGNEIEYPNGITISPDNKYLYIASTTQGIRVLELATKSIIGGPNTQFDSKGLDGIKYYDNSVIGIQNEVKSRSEVKIARYFLDESGTKFTSVKIIDQNNQYFDIPTTFVMKDDVLYCLANSQMANLADSGIRDRKALDDVIILKYTLN